MKISLWRYVIFLITFLTILASLIMIYGIFSNDDAYEYMSLAVLNENMMAEKYFPNDEQYLPLNFELKWYIQIYNKMNESKYVSVRVRILSSNDVNPLDFSNYSAISAPVYGIRDVIMKDDFFITPFSWSLIEADFNESLIKFEMNGEIVDVDIISRDGDQLRIFFELWIFDPIIKEFTFFVSSGFEDKCIWNEFRFSI